MIFIIDNAIFIIKDDITKFIKYQPNTPILTKLTIETSYSNINIVKDLFINPPDNIKIENFEFNNSKLYHYSITDDIIQFKMICTFLKNN